MGGEGDAILEVVGAAVVGVVDPVAGADEGGFRVDVQGALLVAGGLLADSDSRRTRKAVRLISRRIGVVRDAGGGVCIKHCLDIGVGEVGEGGLNPGL